MSFAPSLSYPIPIVGPSRVSSSSVNDEPDVVAKSAILTVPLDIPAFT